MDDERHGFPARTTRWPAVRDFVERRCKQLTVPRGAALRLELVAEELFINLATHGSRANGTLTVDIILRDAGTEVELVFEDSFPSFDPFAGLTSPSPSADPAQRRVGGLGRALVAGLASRFLHERLPAGNRVTVAISKGAGAGHQRK